MRTREEWLDLARKLDWTFSYASEQEIFPEAASGRPWLDHAQWADWDEPYRTSYSEYVSQQHAKESALAALREAIGRIEDFQRLAPSWLSGLKLHAATLPLAEFAAVVGNLRAARFGRDSAWRQAATLGALDELRHTQIPLSLMHDLVRWDAQFDWTHRFFHSNTWVAIAARHFVDELLLLSNPIEFALATHFVFETGFTNLQFVGLSAMAHRTGDRMFEKMVQSIQTDEARHAQIGRAVLETVLSHDVAYAQRLVDKWFWRSWRFFSVVTGFAMDYLTPLASRAGSFKEFMHEWVLEQFHRTLEDIGLQKPWYWVEFVESIDLYHHMVYASAYTYRATVWFDMGLPGPSELSWLREKYPATWHLFEPVWQQISERWRTAGPGVEWYTHGLVPVAFCDLCQLVLSGGSPASNTAHTFELDGQRYVFCSEPCQWIFRNEPERYVEHKGLVRRILDGEAPANLVELLRAYCGLDEDGWGRDTAAGDYEWLRR